MLARNKHVQGKNSGLFVYKMVNLIINGSTNTWNADVFHLFVVGLIASTHATIHLEAVAHLLPFAVPVHDTHVIDIRHSTVSGDVATDTRISTRSEPITDDTDPVTSPALEVQKVPEALGRRQQFQLLSFCCVK